MSGRSTYLERTSCATFRRAAKLVEARDATKHKAFEGFVGAKKMMEEDEKVRRRRGAKFSFVHFGTARRLVGDAEQPFPLLAVVMATAREDGATAHGGRGAMMS